MNIENNILKYYLRNVMFINGTACAGKSTMVAMLAEKYNLVHCGENYHSVMPSEVLTIKQQPNLCYFKTMKDWQEFVNRTPEVFDNWIRSTAREAAEIEVAELIHLSQDRKIIADTNISVEVLSEIADYNQIAIMLSPQSMSVKNFFERDDLDKVFIKEQIMQAKDPEKTMENYKACIAKVNSNEGYAEYAQSGFFTLVRKNTELDTRHEVMHTLANHFGLTGSKDILISTERLNIRPFKENDFEQFKKLLDLYPGWQMQKNDAEGFFKWHLSNYKKMDIEHGYVCLGIFDKDTGTLIGNVGLNEHDDLHVPELGYGILELYRGKGYAKEAAKGVLCWAKSYFHILSLVGTAAVDNIASRKVLEHCGFTLQELKNLKVHITNENYDFAIYRYVF